MRVALRLCFPHDCDQLGLRCSLYKNFAAMVKRFGCTAFVETTTLAGSGNQPFPKRRLVAGKATVGLYRCASFAAAAGLAEAEG